LIEKICALLSFESRTVTQSALRIVRRHLTRDLANKLRVIATCEQFSRALDGQIRHRRQSRQDIAKPASICNGS
jgi:hypothetical protein